MSYPQRKSPRLKDYDYAQSGAYFVTLCTYQHRCLFGHVVNEEVHFSPLGRLAVAHMVAIPDHFPSAELDLWVVMPNHVHAIIVLHEDGSVHLTDVIGNYKAAVTRAWRRAQGTFEENTADKGPPTNEMGLRRGGIYPARTHAKESPHADEDPALEPQRIWHRSFHDHIIRNERALNQIRQHILINPARWSEDHYFRD